MLVRLLQPIRQPLSHMRSDLVVSFAVAFTIMFVSFGVSAAQRPDSFADEVEKLSPSVVNISTTTIVSDGPSVDMPQFPPGSPFEEFFKNEVLAVELIDEENSGEYSESFQIGDQQVTFGLTRTNI